MLRALALAAALGTLAAPASAFTLADYRLSASYSLDHLNGLGLEASAVTYARDRGTLFFVGDEGLGVMEISLTGQTLGTQYFNWSATGNNFRDAEGLTYIGNGRLVVAEERMQRAYVFDYAAGTMVALGPYAQVSNWAYSNIGLEGISHDARDGSFVTVKQAGDGNPPRGPQEVRAGALAFGLGDGTQELPVLFDASLLGLASLSDVQVLSSVDALAGTPYADQLLLLSLDSQVLVQATRSGQVLSSFDLRALTTTEAIEGVTIDERGVIYLIAEHAQGAGAPGNAASRLFVLSPVPEPATWASLLAGLALLGAAVRRRRQLR